MNRLKLLLTRKDSPVPLELYIYPSDISHFVVCPCGKPDCEITICVRGTDTPVFVDNSKTNRKLLGIEA
jgi:hypothetical protein